ncbi:hypothetical protein VC83_05029 [Pseudogymnoascus destructans]|uniref:L-lactate dehydrogenase (cytochrome) n=2 Tax=Pseudogymnoascus destructans TaxID=655981 RepID=L8G2R0_PSED2|nr:uncharacterized protein VC83_05029 [Pseudogymnoascus destructans]ELR06271.1 hypothetical protein GMDG_02065 [Pseudogymnoascus destructans 20631-21]OAF58653.1 hypothetical protein VC83_05029 [Pseudogymnoascus destructans]
MAKVFDAAEVAKHNTSESCWVILYGDVYDVTGFIPEHPGGSKVVLKLAGRDATEKFDPIHPSGTLAENLDPSCKLGRVDLATLVAPAVEEASAKRDQEGPIDVQTLLNLDEFEEVATKKISQKAWAYYYSASDDLFSKSFNNQVYRQILLRPRVFVDCTNCDISTTILGHKVGLPLFVAPAAMARLAHPDGEYGIAQGISSFGALQIISNNASQKPEEIVANSAPGQIFGWQIYIQNDRKKSIAMLKRINALPNIKFIVLTLDTPVPGKREHDERVGSLGKGLDAISDGTGEKRESKGGVGKTLFFGTAMDLTWKTTLGWLKEHTDLPIVLKGVQTHEDAYLAMQFAPQLKAIILSNHGGRALDTAPPAVHTLLEIRKYCPEVLSRIEVWVDGGIKRGTDVVKALCLGAKAVGVGRAALFGLGAGGKEGVERTFEILKGEIETCMKLLGVDKVSDLGPKYINSRAVERDIYDGHAGLEKVGLWVSAKL